MNAFNKKVPEQTWYYRNANNKVIATMSRREKENGKKYYLPKDMSTGEYKMPDIRPLYNVPGILAAQVVVLVNGETVAEALMQQGVTATTLMGGFTAALDKVNWSPLGGKHLIVWPDTRPNLELDYRALAATLYTYGVPSLGVIVLPDDKPLGWNAMDAIAENVDIYALMHNHGPWREF